MSDVDRIPLSADDPSKQASRVDAGSAMLSVTPDRRARMRTSHTAGPVRWFVALLTTVLMLVATLGVAAFAQTSRFGPADGPSFVPASAVAYAELRLDLPGDQRDQLIAFLGSFPGFADPAAFDTKLDETIDQLLGGSDSPISWTEDIKPWFGGQVLLGVPELPDLGGMGMGMGMDSGEVMDAGQSVGVAALGVTDRGALEAALEKLLPTMTNVTTEEYADTVITIVDDGTRTVLAPTDELLLFGADLDQVKGALDVLGGSEASLAEDPGFQEAMAALPADRLGAFWIDTQQIADEIGPLLEQQLEAQPGMAAMAPQLSAALEMLPPAVTGHIRVDADHLTARLDAFDAEAAPSLSVRSTDLAARMPIDSLLYLETRDLGAAVRVLVEQLKPLMAEQDGGAGLQQIEALLGADLESYLDWVEDVAVSASLGIAGPTVGLVATVSDEETGRQRLESLVTLVRLVTATQESAPLEISQEEVDGVTITSIALTDEAGMGDLPVEARISMAIADGYLYLGLGDFAAQALTRDPADSLAASASYQKALGAVGAENAGLLFVDIASSLMLLPLVMGGSDAEMFETQIKPYTDALDFIVAAAGRGETSSWASLMLFVK